MLSVRRYHPGLRRRKTPRKDCEFLFIEFFITLCLIEFFCLNYIVGGFIVSMV